jgi:hypothetical protein
MKRENREFNASGDMANFPYSKNRALLSQNWPAAATASLRKG